MKLLLWPWQRLIRGFRRHLGWKLTLSHLLVALICQLVYIIGGVLIIIFSSMSAVRQPLFPTTSPEMSAETRILALALAPAVERNDPALLSATLAQLPPQQKNGYGAFDGVLSPENLLVVIAPDGQVIATSDPRIPVGIPATALEPAVWAEVLTTALHSGSAPNPRIAGLTGRDEEQRRLVTAYPIVDQQGQIIGALGLRSASTPVAAPPPTLGQILASVSLAVLALFAVVIALSGLIASVAGFMMARAFGRRLRQLEGATEAIIQGNLAARVTVNVPDEIGRVGERFNLLTTRLAETDRARRAFVSNISHELRTPLAIIRGHLEPYTTGPAEAVLPLAVVETIDREAQTLGTLIDDLFTVTRLEESALPVQPTPVQAADVVATAIAGIRPLATAQGHIVVQSLLTADLPLVMADRTRLGQIVTNLLYNALRHTPAGGVIVVEGALVTGQQVVAIAITDTGQGIAAEDLPHIFERFYRGETEEATRQAGSSGLGLTIVKQLVEAQGGTVSAESVLGQGTTIRFTLPRAESSPL